MGGGHFPRFIPRTVAEDGDPLDALILVTYANYPGVVIEARPIGLLRMIDSGRVDDKIICVPNKDPRFSQYRGISNINVHALKEIAHFFQVYKELEGKKVEIIGWMGVDEAKKVISNALKRYSSFEGSEK